MTTHNARDRMMFSLSQNGWIQDPLSHTYRGERKILDPLAFRKDAADGGWWKIRLDYGRSYGTRNTLKRVLVFRVGADGVLPDGYDRHGANAGVLERSRYNNRSLYQVLAYDKDGKTRSISEAAHLLVRDPDLAVWLAAEYLFLEQEREKVRRAERKALQEAKDAPLPITVPQWLSWTSDDVSWRSVTQDLDRTVQKLRMADGTSDLPTLVAQMVQAASAVIAVLNEDAAKELDRQLDDETAAEFLPKVVV